MPCSTNSSVDSAARFVFTSSLCSPALLSSIYQLQNSSQMNPYSSLPTNANSYRSMLAVTDASTSLNLRRIHLSMIEASCRSICMSISSICIWTKRVAFQILLMKFQLDSIFFALKRRSCPGVELVVRKKRSASTPYSSMTSIGSMPLPSDLDIFLPCSSRTSPWISTSLNGRLFMQ